MRPPIWPKLCFCESCSFSEVLSSPTEDLSSVPSLPLHEFHFSSVFPQSPLIIYYYLAFDLRNHPLEYWHLKKDARYFRYQLPTFLGNLPTKCWLEEKLITPLHLFIRSCPLARCLTKQTSLFTIHPSLKGMHDIGGFSKERTLRLLSLPSALSATLKCKFSITCALFSFSIVTVKENLFTASCSSYDNLWKWRFEIVFQSDTVCAFSPLDIASLLPTLQSLSYSVDQCTLCCFHSCCRPFRHECHTFHEEYYSITPGNHIVNDESWKKWSSERKRKKWVRKWREVRGKEQW